VKCIYRNTPSPSPSPEREAAAAPPEEAAAPGSGCSSAERRSGALPPGFLFGGLHTLGTLHLFAFPGKLQDFQLS